MKKLITASGKNFSSKVNTIVKNISVTQYSPDEKQNIIMQEEAIKSSLRRILDNAVLSDIK
jgi:hypothetical protein